MPPTLREAEAAARAFKEAQPQIDAVKDAEKAVKDAKRVLAAYMDHKDLSLFRGITMEVAEVEQVDMDKLRADLGDRIDDFKVKRPRRYFRLVKRARPA